MTLPLLSQNDSQLGRFTTSVRSGCAPLEVIVIEQDNFGDITRQYIYEDGLPETNSTTHTFQQPGVYNIVQIVGVDVDPKTDTLEVEVFENRAVEFAITQCLNNEVLIEIEDEHYDSYHLDFGEGNEINTSEQIISFDFGNEGNKSITIRGAFTNGAQNCQENTQTVSVEQLVNNAEIESVDISRSCLDLITADLSFSLENNKKYQIEYYVSDPNQSTSIDIDESFLRIENIPLDEGINEFCFRANVLSPCDSTLIEGEYICQEIDGSVENSITNAFATYQDEGIQIFFDDPGVSGHQLLRSVEGFEAETIGLINTGFIDRSVSPIRTYTYALTFSDSCGNTSQPKSLAPPFIFSQKTSTNEYAITWIEPLNDLTQLLSSTELIIKGANGSTRVISNPEQNQRILLGEAEGSMQQIQLELTYDTLNTVILSNPIEKQFEFTAYIPDAFTPNGDGLNDRLRAFGLVVDDISCKIYNRWGEIIVLSNDPNNLWDGILNGEFAPVGKYFYSLEYLNVEGQLIQQQGSFVLIRN